jgi:tRNA threonylcarbamoyladenosine biosynthesis protein TsaB
MRLLAIDSCTPVATGAVLTDQRLAAEFVIQNQKTHSANLLPSINQMLKTVDLTVNDMDYIACGIGPGSFTGQRIGVATAKALAHAANKPMVGVSALESMAYNLPGVSELICPIMDARRQQVYTGTYRWEGDVLHTLTKDRAISLQQLLEELKGQDVFFLGDGVSSFRETITGVLGANAKFAPSHLLQVRGGSVAQCAARHILQKESCSYAELQPLYLRLSQAEREYNLRQQTQKGE